MAPFEEHARTPLLRYQAAGIEGHDGTAIAEPVEVTRPPAKTRTKVAAAANTAKRWSATSEAGARLTSGAA